MTCVCTSCVYVRVCTNMGTYVSVLMFELRTSTQLGNLLQLKPLFFLVHVFVTLIQLWGVGCMLVAVSGYSVRVLFLFFSFDYLGPGTLAQVSGLQLQVPSHILVFDGLALNSSLAQDGSQLVILLFQLPKSLKWQAWLAFTLPLKSQLMTA